MTGTVDPAAFSKAICFSKQDLPSMTYALNKAWAISQANRQRMAVYSCALCGKLHLTRKTDGPGTLFCTFPWPLAS